jgi:hypothetical protein
VTKTEYEDICIKRLGSRVFYKLNHARVAVAGLGGLGSHIAVMLARSCVGTLHIIDFDNVDVSNLNRQEYYLEHIGRAKTECLKEKLLSINPYLNVVADNVKITPDNLELFTNGIRSLNNINNNDSCGAFTPTGADGTLAVQDYQNMPNREPDYYQTKNVLLNDDRYLRFFDMKDTGIKNGYYPTMIMEGNDPVFGYVDTSGGPNNNNGIKGAIDNGGAGTYYPSHAMPQRAKIIASTGTKKYTEYLIKASIWDQMAMVRDDSGRYIELKSIK